MSRNPQPSRGLPRALLYALIPVGFALMALAMVWSGRETGGPIADAPVISDVDATAASPSPMDAGLVTDPEVEIGRSGPETGEPNPEPEGTYALTPSGPEGRDNRVIFEN